ncbi:DUF6901 family protein [Thalassolituus sp. LLYu03]|uniref:DUF6901 family protein n=1 Tax=Thalassolituus sp. LLYu03 TaxID=3421656 RepID=UPI003D29285B
MLAITYEVSLLLQEQTRTLTVTLDEHNMERSEPVPEPVPEWIRLDCEQCEHCPLGLAEHPVCPAALSLVPLVEVFSNTVSHEPVALTVHMGPKTLTMRCDAQQAIGSLAGLLLATSACPHLAFLRPLARFHLPMATFEETHIRAIAFYLLGQYWREQNGLSGDFSCNGLTQRYEALGSVNVQLAKRLRVATEKDSMVNAVVILDMLARTFSLSPEDLSAELNQIYASYLSPR